MASRTAAFDSPHRVTGALFGREPVLSKLSNTLDQARGRHGRCISLIGDPGIGKTALVEEFLQRARSQGARIAVGRCLESEWAPFRCWAQMLRTLDGELWRERLEPLFETRGDAPGTGAADQPALRPLSDQDGRRGQQFDAVVTALRRVATDQPVVCLLEDIHWADTDSILLLQFVTRELFDAAVLLLLTHRPFEIYEPTSPITRALRSWERDPACERIRLGGLEESDSTMLLSRVGGDRLPKSVARRIVASSAGNPFLVCESARDYLEHDAMAQSQPAASGDVNEFPRPPMPEDVRDVVLARIARLAVRTQEYLHAAAILGEYFELPAMAGLGGASDETAPTDEAFAALEEAQAAGLARPISGSLSRYRFVHSLVREAICESMPPDRRRRLHARAVTILEALPSADGDTRWSELAHHSYESAHEGNARRAAFYNRLAAKHAEKICAYAEAVGFYDRAIEAHLLDAPEDHRTHAGLLLEAAGARWWAGERESANDAFSKAAALSRVVADGEMHGWAVLGSIDPTLSTGVASEHTIAVLEHALRGAPEHDELLRIHIVGRLSAELRSSPRAARGEALIRELLDRIRKSGDQENLANACNHVRFGIWGPDNLQERLEIATEGLESACHIGARGIEAQLRLWRLIDYLEAGRCVEAQAEMARFQTLAERARAAWMVWQERVIQAMRALVGGDFSTAEELAQAALRLGLDTGQSEAAILAAGEDGGLRALRLGLDMSQSEAAILYGVFQFQLCQLRGTLGSLEAPITAFVSRYPGVRAWRAGLALVHLANGQDGSAREQLQTLLADGFDAIPRDPAYLGTLALAAEAAVRLQDHEYAAGLYEALRAFSGRLVVLGNAAACLGSVDSLLGALSGTLGEPGAAEHFEAGLSIEASLGALALTTRTRLFHGSWLAKRDPARAREQLSQAERDAQQLGMERVRSEAEAALKRMDAGQRSPAEAPGRHGVLRRDGDYWTIGLDGREFHLRATKGLRALALLLQHPNRDFSALELSALTSEEAVPEETTAAPLRAESGLPRLDRQAVQSYRKRLSGLRAQLEEAEANNDTGRQSALRKEIDFLATELAGGVGLGGRIRQSSSSLEKARLNATRAIKRTIGRIEREDDRLGHYLRTTIRTGKICRYDPSPELAVDWHF